MNDLKQDQGSNVPRKFRLDKQDAKLAGVCSGLANYMGIDATIMRIVFVAGTLIGFGIFLPVYILIWLLAD